MCVEAVSLVLKRGATELTWQSRTLQFGSHPDLCCDGNQSAVQMCLPSILFRICTEISRRYRCGYHPYCFVFVQKSAGSTDVPTVHIVSYLYRNQPAVQMCLPSILFRICTEISQQYRCAYHPYCFVFVRKSVGSTDVAAIHIVSYLYGNQPTVQMWLPTHIDRIYTEISQQYRCGYLPILFRIYTQISRQYRCAYLPILTVFIRKSPGSTDVATVHIDRIYKEITWQYRCGYRPY